MELILLFVLSAALNWTALMIVIPVAGRIAGFSFPGFKEAAAKLAILVAVTRAVAVALGPVIGMGATILNLIIFWTAMVKWFQVDFFGAIIIVVINGVVTIGLAVALGALLGGLLA